MKQKETNFSLKDKLFNKDKVQHLAELIFSIHPDFNKIDFVNDVIIKFPDLELMGRVHHIVEIYHKYLPENYPDSLEILLKSLPPELDPNNQDNDFWDFIYAPYSHFVSKYWCEKKYLDISLRALKEMTKRFSCEFAIRKFINEFEDETCDALITWSTDNNYHVRRLSSEWCRANLPWWTKIWLDYKKAIPIVDNLYSDNTRYVTRSVANHLNDISKKDPQLVTDTLKRWKKAGAKDIDYIISHSTRSLVKSWDPATLELLWFSPDPNIVFENFSIHNTQLQVPTDLDFSFDIICDTKQNLIIDYKLYFRNKSWKLVPKVFKIKKWEFQWTTHISKKHPLKLMTTKALYPWKHFVEVMINWKSCWKKSFELKI